MNILVVEDDDAFRDGLARALTRRAHRVTAAAGSEEALALTVANPPEAAILDLKLRGTESGLHLIAPLKGCNPNMRIVLLTGYASIATAVEAIKLGATHYLAKPADVDDILAALDRDQGQADAQPVTQPLPIERLEWEHIQKVLAEYDGNISATARALRMHRRTLQRKLAKKPVREGTTSL